MGKPCINLRLPGQHMKTMAAFSGARQWAATFYPGLKNETTKFLSMSQNLSIPFPNFKDDKERLDWIQQHHPADQAFLKAIGNNQKGALAELKTQEFFSAALQDKTPKLFINNFKRERFCHLFGGFKCHAQQEAWLKSWTK